MTKEIPLTQGMVALVDDDDYYYLAQWKWYFGQGYARRSEQGKNVHMHRVVLRAPSAYLVDHVNGNTLDNCKSNLRLTGDAGNARNASARKDKRTSHYKGVYLAFRYGRERWRAQIQVDHQKKHIGHFDNEIDAARAYDRAARTYFGLYARLNFPDE